MNPNFWITLVGIILALLGVLYGAYGYFNIKIFKTLTESFAFGLVGGIIFGSVLGLFLTFGCHPESCVTRIFPKGSREQILQA